jgi:hypothetical protein
MDLGGMDAAGLLAVAGDAVRRRRLAEVEDLQVLLAWADLHSMDPTQGPDGRYARRVGNVLTFPGGQGTPGVQDFCLGEIAIARGTGVTATVNALADVLDLAHRLPATWAVCRRGDAEVWVARRVAKMSRHLPAAVVAVVDSAISRMIASHAAGRVLEVAEAKVIEADPVLHEARREAERRRRYVGLGRTDEHGLRTLIARLEAGDATAVDAVVHRVAEVLAHRDPDASTDELRAEAFGWLARPAELLQLLLEHTHSDKNGDDQAALDLDLDDGDEPHPVSRALAFPADLLDALRHLDLSVLRPKAVLHVHLHEAALGHAGQRLAKAVARVEGLGPASLAQLRTLLARTDLRIQPVKDLSSRVRHTAYEHPEAVRDQVHLITGGDYWPFATSTTRAADLDHPTPYDADGPPGQTGPHNCGPLTRRHHRWKTHAGYTSRQAGDGRYVWITPHGLAYLVDHTGTHRIDPHHARAIHDAPPGVDVYPGHLIAL